MIRVTDSCTNLLTTGLNRALSAFTAPHSVVPEDVEDVAQQNQRASGESVQVLGVGHLQGFPEEASATQADVEVGYHVQGETSGACEQNTLSFTVLGLVIASLKE